MVAAAVELRVAGVKRCFKGLGKSKVGGVVARVLVTQLPDPISQGRDFVAVDGEREVVPSTLLRDSSIEFPAQQQPPQHGQHLDVEQVRGVHVTSEGVQQLLGNLAADQRLNHRGGVEDDHRRPDCTAAARQLPAILTRSDRSRPLAASHCLEPNAREVSMQAARLLSEGRRAEAAAAKVGLQNPWLRGSWVLRLVAPVMGHVFYPTGSDGSGVLVATHAVNDPDVADLLPTITAPVLLLCVDKDHFASSALYEQTARLIPDARLVVYAGKGHLGAISDPRLAPDILNFVARGGTPSTLDPGLGPTP